MSIWCEIILRRAHAAAGAKRHARLLKIEQAAVRENMGAILFKSLFALWYLPLAPYTQARKNISQEIAGFWRLGL